MMIALCCICLTAAPGRERVRLGRWDSADADGDYMKFNASRTSICNIGKAGPMNPLIHRKSLVVIGAIAAFASAASAQPAPSDNKPDVTLGSTPDTVVWGYISSRTPPVLRIKSGTTVRIDTMSHQGLTTNADPVTYFGRAGIKPEEVLQDAKDIYAKVPRGKGLGVHVLTGPIYVEGAEPGEIGRAS